MKTLTRGDFVLSYDHQGPAGGETVLFFNGSLSTMASWNPLIRCLIRSGRRALLHDQRGQLLSPWNAAFSYGDIAQDAAALLDETGEKRVHVVGISYGSVSAQTFAADYPERTASLLLISAFSEMDANTEAWVRRFVAWGSDAVEHPDARRKVYENMAPLFFGPAYAEANASSVQAAADAFAGYPKGFFQGMIRIFENQLANTPVTGNLGRISCPTLVVHAERDVLTPWFLSEIILDNIPGAEALRIPEAGHAVNAEQPGLLDGIITGFVTRHGST